MMPTDKKGTPQAITLGSENGVKKDFRQLCKYGKDFVGHSQFCACAIEYCVERLERRSGWLVPTSIKWI